MMRSRAFVRGCSFLLKRRRQYYRDRVILTTGRQLRRLSVVQDNNNKNKEDEIPTIKTSENDATTSSCASIYNPPPFEIQDERLARNVRSCLREHIENPPEENDEVPLKAAPVKDTGMSICFLGTSAGSPTRFRSPTSTLVRLGGKSLLFDVGEGTQRQMDFTRAKPSHVDSIFITHLHGDHIFGLPGFLLFLQYSKIDEQRLREQTANAAASKNRKPPPEHTINIYGPPGLYNYVAASTTMACTSFQHVQIIVHELVGGRVKRVRKSGQHQTHKDPFYHTYQEFEHSYLTRKIIPCDQNGIWNIEDFTKNLTREEILSSTKRNTEASSTLRIRAAEVDHLPGVKTFGYVLQEKDPPRNIDASKAEELGVPGGKKYELLKHGYSVHSEDGERLIHPEEVWTDRRRAARKIAIVGDNRAWSPELEHIARDADVLVHEATLHKFNYLHGHSTPAMAGAVAKKINAAVLVLNHISPRFDSNPGTLYGQVKHAKDRAGHKSSVIMAYDFLEILVPWLGFHRSLPYKYNETDNSNTATTKTDGESTRNPETGNDDGTTEELEGKGLGEKVKNWFKPSDTK